MDGRLSVTANDTESSARLRNMKGFRRLPNLVNFSQQDLGFMT
jgi:hypothetical protein